MASISYLPIWQNPTSTVIAKPGGCVEAETVEEARELLAAGAGYRCHWRVYKYRSRLRRRLSYDPGSERKRCVGFFHEFRSCNYRCHQGGEGPALAKLTPDA